MGQKVNPHGLRVGVIKDWDSRWYAESDFADYLVEDYNIRTFLKKKLYSAGVSKIEIERASDRVKVIIYTAKPGIVIGWSKCRLGAHFAALHHTEKGFVGYNTYRNTTGADNYGGSLAEFLRKRK